MYRRISNYFYIIFDERPRVRFDSPPIIAIPDWLRELRKTPRRMKRPFPASKPALPRVHKRPCY